MEIKEKKLTSASYNVVAQSGTLSLSGKVTIADSKVKSIVGCKVLKNETPIAQFGMFADNQVQVTYNTEVYDERVEVLNAIDEFTTLCENLSIE